MGFARAAAAASLAWGWANTVAPQIVAITVEANERCWDLTERLEMTRVMDGDFDHPVVPEGSPLKRHNRYRFARPG